MTGALADLPAPPPGRTGWPWTEDPGPGYAGEAYPRVSIVTPSYNQGQFIEETIRSVLLQGYPNLEYIVIDGGSSDGTVEIIRKYEPWLAYWISEPDRGQSHAINKGLRRATGEILSWLNSDDVLLPGTVRRAVERLRGDEQIDVVYGRLNRIDSRSQPLPTPELPKDRLEFGAETVIGECIVNQPGCFWRREVMDRVGLLNEDLHYAMDYEFWVRMILAGARFKRLPETVANFRLSSDSKTVGHTADHALEHLAIVDSFLSDPCLPEKLDLSPSELCLQANKGRSILNIYASWGHLKRGKRSEALVFLWRAISNWPAVILDSRWAKLLVANLVRSLRAILT